MLKVIIGTYNTSRVPEFAGSTWVRLQYMLGFLRLGFECYWVDHLETPSDVHSVHYLLNRFHRTACDFGFRERYCILDENGKSLSGLTDGEFRSIARAADLLVSISGHLPRSSPMLHIPRRALVDVDPGFTQIWAQECDMGFAEHNYFFTVGQNVGYPEFGVPTGDVEWIPTVPPVCLDCWPVAIEAKNAAFTSVADWRGSQTAVLAGRQYEGKRTEFLRFLSLPCKTEQEIEVALTIGYWDYPDISLLLENKWNLVDPYLYAGDPFSYREYIQRSRAEFSVAKQGYVQSNSGWISDRTVCYLASGKPALVQSTGFEERIPTGNGLLTFKNEEDALEGIRTINQNYLAHCDAARRLAEERFGSDLVLGKILERVGL
jgi:hypothetical protein